MDMHKYLIPFCLLLTGLAPTAAAQQAGDYVRDPNLEKFEGRWQAENAPYTLTIVFKKEKVHYEKVDIHTDLVLGWSQLEREGKVIESSLDRVGNGYFSSSFNGGTPTGNSYRLELNMVDIKRQCSYNATFRVDKEKPNTGKLEIDDRCKMRPPDMDDTERTGLPLPSEWQMEKIH